MSIMYEYLKSSKKKTSKRRVKNAPNVDGNVTMSTTSSKTDKREIVNVSSDDDSDYDDSAETAVPSPTSPIIPDTAVQQQKQPSFTTTPDVIVVKKKISDNDITKRKNKKITEKDGEKKTSKRKTKCQGIDTDNKDGTIVEKPKKKRVKKIKTKPTGCIGVFPPEIFKYIFTFLPKCEWIRFRFLSKGVKEICTKLIVEYFAAEVLFYSASVPTDYEYYTKPVQERKKFRQTRPDIVTVKLTDVKEQKQCFIFGQEDPNKETILPGELDRLGFRDFENNCHVTDPPKGTGRVSTAKTPKFFNKGQIKYRILYHTECVPNPANADKKQTQTSNNTSEKTQTVNLSTCPASSDDDEYTDDSDEEHETGIGIKSPDMITKLSEVRISVDKRTITRQLLQGCKCEIEGECEPICREFLSKQNEIVPKTEKEYHILASVLRRSYFLWDKDDKDYERPTIESVISKYKDEVEYDKKLINTLKEIRSSVIAKLGYRPIWIPKEAKKDMRLDDYMIRKVYKVVDGVKPMEEMVEKICKYETDSFDEHVELCDDYSTYSNYSVKTCVVDTFKKLGVNIDKDLEWSTLYTGNGYRYGKEHRHSKQKFGPADEYEYEMACGSDSESSSDNDE